MIKFTSKLFRTGSSIAVTVPVETIRKYNLETGQYLDIEVKEVFTKSTTRVPIKLEEVEQ